MSEEQQGGVAVQLISKFGLPTALLLIVGYFLYGDIIKPLAGQYQELLLEVKLNNTEIRKGILELGEENRKRIAKIEDQILAHSELIATGIKDVAERNSKEIERVEGKLDKVLEAR